MNSVIKDETYCIISIYDIKASPSHRPRVTKFGNAYYPKRYKEFKDNFTKALKELDTPFYEDSEDESLYVYITYHFKPSMSLSKKKKSELLNKIYCKNHGDIDNLNKGVLDCMNNVVYRDDKQIVSLNSVKMYGERDKIQIYISKVKK